MASAPVGFGSVVVRLACQLISTRIEYVAYDGIGVPISLGRRLDPGAGAFLLATPFRVNFA